MLGIETSLRMLGRRPDYYVEYSVGSSVNDSYGTGFVLINMLGTVYSVPNFSTEIVYCKTSIPGITSVRGPGWIPANFITEHTIIILFSQSKTFNEVFLWGKTLCACGL